MAQYYDADGNPILPFDSSYVAENDPIDIPLTTGETDRNPLLPFDSNYFAENDQTYIPLEDREPDSNPLLPFDSNYIAESDPIYTPGATGEPPPEDPVAPPTSEDPVSVPEYTPSMSQEGQNVANEQGTTYNAISAGALDRAQTGVGFADYDANKTATDLGNNVSFGEVEGEGGYANYLDKAGGTVAGQLNKLLSSDSPYIQQAKYMAETAAGSRGLMNSSIAAGSGVQASIREGLEVAKQDAQNIAEMVKSKQDAEYNLETIQAEAIASGVLNQQTASIQQKHDDINNSFSALLQGAAAQDQTKIANLQNFFNEGMELLTRQTSEILLDKEIDGQMKQLVTEMSGQMFQNFNVTVENWLQDPDFLNMGDTAVNNAINQTRGLVGATVSLMYENMSPTRAIEFEEDFENFFGEDALPDKEDGDGDLVSSDYIKPSDNDTTE